MKREKDDRSERGWERGRKQTKEGLGVVGLPNRGRSKG